MITFQQLQLTVLKSHYEQITEALENEGALAITYLDAEDQPIYEPLPDTFPIWDTIIIKALFSEDANLSTITNQLGISAFQIEMIEDQAWEKVCMEQFQPMQFGNKLWICPSWHQDSFISQHKDAVIVLLDPGLAFGTGSHPTTRLCLNWLELHAVELWNKTIIDYGCGSGILGIAALKLGAKAAIGLDIDPQALLASQENAQKNKVDFQTITPEQLQLLKNNIKVDMIIANILAGPLGELAETFFDLLEKKGKLVLSGILEEQVEMLKNIYENEKMYFKLNTLTLDEGWAIMEWTKQ